MRPTMSWYQTLAWSFFTRQAAAILGLLAVILWVAYSEAERGAKASANASLSAGAYLLDRAFEQQGQSMDGGLEVFTQYSGNVALVERSLEMGAPTSLADALAENLPRLNAEIALVMRPDGQVLACTARNPRSRLPEVGILQMALAPEEAKGAGYPGPYYRGFLRVDWGERPGIYHAVARPLHSPGGRALGAMLVGVRVDDRIATDLRRLAIAGPQRGDPSAHLALLSQFRALGSTLPEAEHLDRLLAREPAFLAARSQVLDGQTSSVLPFRMDGRNYLGMIFPLRGVNALDLEMGEVLLMPMDPLLAPFRNLQRAILAVGLAGLVIALGLSLHSARRVTAPLKALASAAQSLAEGQLPETLAVEATPDEVGVLTRTFKSMLAELRAKDELLALLESAQKERPGAAPQAPLRTMPLPGGEGLSGAGEEDPTRRLRRPSAAAEALPASLREGGIFANRYRVEGVLGRGGMGVVLKVHDLQLDEDVALKVVRAELASNPAFLDMLKQEIRLARKITHRYVLRTHDFGEAEGLPFVTMEFLKGITLRDLMDGRGRLPAQLALRIARQVAEGLEAAHAVGVVHRDIKPANVLFDVRGDAKIMDFGLAAPAAPVALGALGPQGELGAAGSAGDGGTLLGSPRYMSPEQILGDPVDARTDLYALGIMLYELCSGLAPFHSPRINELLRMHLEAPIPALQEAAPELAALVGRLMQKRQDQRPQSAAEVVEILKVIAANGGGTSRA